MMSEKEIMQLKTGTPASRKRLIEVLRIAHNPKLTFEQALAKVRATREALEQAQKKESNKP